jgi:hypothetical protein
MHVVQLLGAGAELPLDGELQDGLSALTNMPTEPKQE